MQFELVFFKSNRSIAQTMLVWQRTHPKTIHHILKEKQVHLDRLDSEKTES